ncbi:hypothetical protein Hanom_Chr11g01059561 [Helianthus anomalus]
MCTYVRTQVCINASRDLRTSMSYNQFKCFNMLTTNNDTRKHKTEILKQHKTSHKHKH